MHDAFQSPLRLFPKAFLTGGLFFFTKSLWPSLIRTRGHAVLKHKMHPFSILIAPVITVAFVQATNPHCLSNHEASTFIEEYTDLITKTQANFNLTLATQL